MARKVVEENVIEEVKLDALVEKIEKEPKPIYIGTATTDLDVLKKGEKVKVVADEGDNWITENGMISKLYLLLEKI